MRHRIRDLSTLTAGTLLACALACPRSPPAAPAAEDPLVDILLDGETMGSTWHIKIKAKASEEQAVRALQTPIDELLERVNDQMSTYRPNSEISRFNAQKSTAPFAVSAELAHVVQKALEVGAATDGAYDITLDPLINLWGFDRKGPRQEPPGAKEIAEARKHTGLALVGVDVANKTLTKRDPEVAINLGGIAAGWAVDELAKLIESKGRTDWMIEVTGEVRARGTNSRGKPWKIGVKVPDIAAPQNEIVAAVPLENLSLTTSGSYHNFFEAGGKRFHHILNPKTGAPVETDIVSVTVLYSDAVTADGYDTPFLILGEAASRAIIAKTPGMEALFIHQDAKTGALSVSTTAGFPKLEQMEHSP